MEVGNPSRKSDRLSVSTHTTTPPRAITASEISSFRAIADCLIPATAEYRGGSDVADFNDLITKAAALTGSKFSRLMQLATEIDPTNSPGEIWNQLKKMSEQRPGDFYVLSTTVVAAYIYSDEMKETLAYPRPHQNPASMFDVAEELSSGVLDPVCERGRTYVDLD